MALAYGAQNTFGVFFKPMSSEFGWDRAETSGPFALYMIVHGILNIITGRLSDRFGPQKLVTLGGIILGLGYILMSFISGLWHLYLFYGVLVAVGSSAIYIPLVVTIARWFTKQRGLMSGLGISGIGFGIAVMPAIASQLIVRFQWRIPLLVIGGILMVFICLLARLLRNSPETLSSADSRENLTKDVPESEKGFSFKQARKTRQFWMIFVAWILYGFFYQIGIVHIVPYATDLGMSVVAAATILTTIGLVGTLGRISLGFISDRLGNWNTVFASYALMGLAYLGLAVSQTIWMLYLFAIIFGFLFGIGILLIPIVAEYFGFKELGIISGTILFANSLGGAIGPLLAGSIFDATGSYLPVFISCTATGLVAALMIRLIRPTQGITK
jgi:MFS family permease